MLATLKRLKLQKKRLAEASLLGLAKSISQFFSKCNEHQHFRRFQKTDQFCAFLVCGQISLSFDLNLLRNLPVHQQIDRF